MENQDEVLPRVAELWLQREARAAPAWLRLGKSIRRAWLTLWRGRPERNYVARTLRRMANGRLRETLGVEVYDEALTRSKSQAWFDQLVALGLRPDHLCVEYGCGSLWCAEPFIRYMQPGKFVGLDVTNHFYALGRQRLGTLLEERQVRLDVISRRSLRETAALKPDFVFSHRVLHHVPRYGLARYMRSICALLDERTVLVIENRPRPIRKGPAWAPRHSAAEFQSYLPAGWVCRTQPFGFVVTHVTRASSV